MQFFYCPKCKSILEKGGGWWCATCKIMYPYKDDTPDLENFQSYADDE